MYESKILLFAEVFYLADNAGCVGVCVCSHR